MKIWQSDISLEDINQRATNSFSDHIGITFVELGDDYLCAKMPITSTVTQPMGIMHGGASASLAETVASAAANFCIDNEKQVCVGLELNINHIKSKDSGYILGMAQPLHLGKRTQVWEIIITDEKDTLISVSRLTLAVVDKKKD